MKPVRLALATSGCVTGASAQGFAGAGAAAFADAARTSAAARTRSAAGSVRRARPAGTALRSGLARDDLGARVERLELELGETLIEWVTHPEEQKERLVERAHPAA